MSNSVQDTTGATAHADTPMDTAEQVGKGKGKQTEEMPIDESEEDGSEEEVSRSRYTYFCSGASCR